MLFLGLDLGTGGIRIIICDQKGEVVVRSETPFPPEVSPQNLPPGWSEQEPDLWTKCSLECLRKALSKLEESRRSPKEIKAICVDSTSGTIIPVNGEGKPLSPAIMYNDIRSGEEAKELNKAGRTITEKVGYKFKPTFALAKILWIKKNWEEVYQKTQRFIHPTDFINLLLTGYLTPTDTSNALKTGYDLVDRRWPRFISREIGISRDLLPEVVKPGEKIGEVSRACARETGLAPGTSVVAGMTDGVAAFFASGARRSGEWNTTLGTTLVVKGIAEHLIKDREENIYCHLHPDGYWLPGAASNVGGECLNYYFPPEKLEELNARATDYIPTRLLIYPLMRKGERFPFQNSEAEGFMAGRVKNDYHLFVGFLEGVGLVERWSYEIVEKLGAEVKNRIYTTGGGARSLPWLRIRASILNKQVARPKYGESAFGSAVVAASHIAHSDLTTAIEEMVKLEITVDPEKELVKFYQAKYRRFREACRVIGYE